MTEARRRARPSRPRLAGVLLLPLALGGCSLFGDDKSNCASVEEYQDAKTAPEISVPAGLDAPDPSTRLSIPPGPEPTEPLAKNAACLQFPPDYFDKPLTKSNEAN